MGAIVDVLLLGKHEINLVVRRYPACVVRNMTNSNQLTQKYRLIIPNEDLDDTYYNFLVDNGIAMSSANFRCRIDSDAKFTERMRTRAIAKLDKSPDQ